MSVVKIPVLIGTWDSSNYHYYSLYYDNFSEYDVSHCQDSDSEYNGHANCYEDGSSPRGRRLR